MPRATIDLSPLFSFLAGNKTLKPNPDYYASPGEVPFDYAGDPSDLVGKGDPYMRPTLGEAYFNPQLMADYNQFTYGPAKARQAFAIEQEQFPTRQAQQLDTSGKLLEQGEKIRQTQWPAEDARAIAQAEAEFERSKGHWPEQDTRALAQSAALGEQNFQQTIKHAPDLSRVQSEGELAAQKAARDVKMQEAQAHWAKVRSTGYLPASHSALSDAQLAALYPDGIDFGKLGTESEAVSGNVLNTPQVKASNADVVARGLAGRLPLMNQAAELGAKGDVFQATHGMPFGEVFKSPVLPTMGDTSASYGRNPAYVSPAMREWEETGEMLKAMKGGNKIGTTLLKANTGMFPPKQAPSIPISGSPTTGRVTAAQIDGDFGNGKPWQLQAMQPTPDASRPLAGEGIAVPQATPADLKANLDKWISQDPSGVGTRRSKARDAMIDVVTSVLQPPIQYVGSSNIPSRSGRSIIGDQLANPKMKADLIKQLDALPPEVLSQIYSAILERVQAR